MSIATAKFCSPPPRSISHLQPLNNNATPSASISIRQFISPSPNVTRRRFPSLSFSLGSGPYPITGTGRSVFLPFSTTSDSLNATVGLEYDDGGDGGDGGKNNFSGGGGGGGSGGNDGNESSGDSENNSNKKEALMALAEAGRSMESLPMDLKAAIEDGKIPGSIILKYFELEKTPLFAWLMKFGGFKERLLADDLFLAKVFMECGVGMFTKVPLFFFFCSVSILSCSSYMMVVHSLGKTLPILI